MTGLLDTGEIFLNTPQWSRPGIGRMTWDQAQTVIGLNKPQWSRPGIGRMTAREI